MEGKDTTGLTRYETAWLRLLKHPEQAAKIDWLAVTDNFDPRKLYYLMATAEEKPEEKPADKFQEEVYSLYCGYDPFGYFDDYQRDEMEAYIKYPQTTPAERDYYTLLLQLLDREMSSLLHCVL